MKLEKRSSRFSCPVDAAGGHAVNELMSKLNGEPAPRLELPLPLSVAGGDGSNEDANDMNMGLAAIEVYGAFEAKPVVAPKPKSICIAPSVAVDCGISSKRLSLEGSKAFIELQSRGF